MLGAGCLDVVGSETGEPQTSAQSILTGARVWTGAPGFIDNHTHFNRAGELLLGVNLLDVADAESFRQRVTEARDRLPRDAGMVGGDWGAYEAWGRSSTGREESSDEESKPFSPDRTLLDPLTPEHPALLSRWDRSVYLARGGAGPHRPALCRCE